MNRGILVALCLFAAIFALQRRSVRSESTGPATESKTPAPRSATLPSDHAPHPTISRKGRESIDRGTKWLISAMRQDGMVGADIGQPPDLSCTAMVGLTLLAQGNTPHAGPHAAELSRILDAVLIMVDWIPRGAQRTEKITLVQRKIGLNADRFLAALFLSQVLGEADDGDETVRAALEKLVHDISAEQGKDGTWGDESWAPVLGTVLGWESLRAANSCGLKVDASANSAGEALRKNLKKSMYRNDGWMHDFYKNASSIRVLYSMGFKSDPEFKECVDATLRFADQDDRPFTLAGGEEYLAFFLVTECFLSSADEKWQHWYPVVSDKIMRRQNADGSWSGHHCITNRTFCTAAAMLTIQTPNFCLPISNL